MKPKSQLQRLLQLEGGLLRRPQMDMQLAMDEDYHHSLASQEHEAFYFLFTSADGKITDGLRTLFGQADVLEIVGLRVADQGWVHQDRVDHFSESALSSDASGPLVKMKCVEPWSFAYLGQPGESYIGAPGEENVQRKSQVGDSFVDHIGPALFISSKEESGIGFWDDARRIRA